MDPEQKPVVSKPFLPPPPQPAAPELSPVQPPQPALPPAAPAPPEMSGPPQPSRKNRYKSILSTIAIFLAAPLVALALTAYVFQSYEVDGPSMETTLQDNDRLIVLKLSKNISRLKKRVYLPARWDIIVFNRPATANSEERQ